MRIMLVIASCKIRYNIIQLDVCIITGAITYEYSLKLEIYMFRKYLAKQSRKPNLISIIIDAVIKVVLL